MVCMLVPIFLMGIRVSGSIPKGHPPSFPILGSSIPRFQVCRSLFFVTLVISFVSSHREWISFLYNPEATPIPSRWLVRMRTGPDLNPTCPPRMAQALPLYQMDAGHIYPMASHLLQWKVSRSRHLIQEQEVHILDTFPYQQHQASQSPCLDFPITRRRHSSMPTAPVRIRSIRTIPHTYPLMRRTHLDQHRLHPSIHLRHCQPHGVPNPKAGRSNMPRKSQ